ncbi:putative bromodomain adjacent to zinc finger domain protein [Sesbania bispinosa]|nr:putative bromodomain adjacent to zinc finger domain protein [Sesbania bispinosa]
MAVYDGLGGWWRSSLGEGLNGMVGFYQVSLCAPPFFTPPNSSSSCRANNDYLL